MRKDPEIRVQFQLAFTLGQVKDPRELAALAELASAHGSDPWFRAAILSSLPDSASPLFDRLLSSKERHPALLSELASLIGAKHDATEVSRLLTALSAGRSEGEWRAAALSGLAKGLQLGDASGLKLPSAEAGLMKLLDSPSEKVRSAAVEVAQHVELRAWIERASRDAAAANLPADRRLTAIRSLEGGRFASVGPVLRRVLDPREPPEIQAAAVESLAVFDDPEVGSILLANWKSYSPEVRKKALEALLAHRERAPQLLQAVESRQIEPGAIEAGARDRLLEHPDPALRERARRLFLSQSGDRPKVVEAFHSVVNLSGDLNRGKQAFEKSCAKCHMPRRQGGRVGPDLSGINNKSKEELLMAILNPSAEIDPRYVNYVVVTKDGRMHDGILVNETPGSLTLRGDSEQGDVTILRPNLAEIRASGVSLMPEDLEKQMSRQDLADVIAYLRGGL